MSAQTPETGIADRNRLIAAIEDAFASTPSPLSITECEPDCPECNGLTAEFQDKKWQEIDDAKIEANYSLASLAPKAFHYFLPAYLRYSLQHFNMDSRVCEFTIYSTLPYGGSDKSLQKTAWMRERVSCFNRRQAQIVLQFLQLVSQDEELSGYHTDIEEGISRLKSMLRELKLLE